MNYILNEYGEVVETDEVFTNGKFRIIDGKMVRVGNASAPPDRPYSTKDSFANPVLNPMDGKYYTNMGSYEDAVKAKGGKILGNDAPTQRAKPKTESINWEKAVAETLKTSP